jgi:murein DD-endopeptidase MepM/ murein hydrolase activator NlpD
VKLSTRGFLFFAGLVVLSLIILFLVYYRRSGAGIDRTRRLLTWLAAPHEYPGWSITAGQQCDQAPFLLPTSGYVGYLWDDSFRPGHRHQGIDIFGGSDVNTTPVVAAYSGYLTRLPEWRSAVIIRIPDDPLEPGRQIWTYYTHMADAQGNSFIEADYPPGTVEKYVQAGSFLGYQGNYSGSPGNPVGVHLHFSIVRDDGRGKFLNELAIANTLDPSAYLGLPLNAQQDPDQVPVCVDPGEPDG